MHFPIPDNLSSLTARGTVQVVITTYGDISVHRNGHTGAQISTSTTNGRERVR